MVVIVNMWLSLEGEYEDVTCMVEHVTIILYGVTTLCMVWHVPDTVYTGHLVVLY